MRRLLDREQADLRDRGFVHLRGVLDRALLAPLIAELEAAIDASARRLFAAGKIPSLFDAAPFDERLARISDHSLGAFKAIWSGNHHGPALFDLLRSPAILALVEPLIGPEIWCHPAYRIRPKLPDRPRTAGLTVVPWHQDSAYMSEPCDRVMIPTVWVPLTSSTDENGCLEFIPHAHARGILRHLSLPTQPYLEIDPAALPEGPRVLVPAEPGDVVLLNNISVHRSRPNRTEKLRWSADLRYHDPSIPSGYPLEHGFLVQSRSTPEAVVRTAEDFARIREAAATGDAPRNARWAITA